jgi:hypothetical protein
MIKEFDLMLDADDDLLLNGDLVIGESFVQEVGIIVRLNQGELKSDPLLGPNLITMTNGKVSALEVKTKLKVHLERDNKSFEDAEKALRINTKTNG